MKVYIVNNEYNTDCESYSSILVVYDSMEKAQNQISELYQEDCDWLREWTPNDDVTEFEEDTHEENYTYIQYDYHWSKNWIEEFEVE